MRILFLFLLFFVCSFAHAQPTIEWQKAYGGSGIDGAVGINTIPQMDVLQTSDGGYIYVSSAASIDGDVTVSKGIRDVWVIKTDNTGTIQWQKSYGGSMDNIGYSIAQTKDGGYIVSSITTSTDGDVTGSKGLNDLWILKLDASGAISWQKSMGGGAIENSASSIKQTADGGFITVCITSSITGDVGGKHGTAFYDIWVVKLNAAASLEWQKCLGGTDQESAASVEIAKDGGYIVAGATQSTDGDITGTIFGLYDAWLVKLSATGSIEWQKTYGGTKADYFGMAIPAVDGGYIAVGNTNSKDHDVTSTHDTTDIWVVKTDDTGKIVWQKTFGGSKYDVGYSIAQTPEGHYLVCGTTASSDGDVNGLKGLSNIFLLDLYPNGSIRWTKTIGTTKSEWTSRARPTADGGTIVISSISDSTGDATGSHFHGGASDIWVVKLGSTADVITLNTNTGIRLYPNPASEKVTVEIMTANAQHTSLTLCDMKGTVLKNIETSESKTDIDLSALPQGLYLLEYTNGDYKQVVKLTKR